MTMQVRQICCPVNSVLFLLPQFFCRMKNIIFDCLYIIWIQAVRKIGHAFVEKHSFQHNFFNDAKSAFAGIGEVGNGTTIIAHQTMAGAAIGIV